MVAKRSDAKQRARFIEVARTLGTDENEAAFKAKLGVIARQKPTDKQRVENEESSNLG